VSHTAEKQSPASDKSITKYRIVYAEQRSLILRNKASAKKKNDWEF